MQNLLSGRAAAQPRRRRKAAGWQAFPCKKQCFVGFASFVIIIRVTGYKPIRQSRRSAVKSAK